MHVVISRMCTAVKVCGTFAIEDRWRVVVPDVKSTVYNLRGFTIRLYTRLKRACNRKARLEATIEKYSCNTRTGGPKRPNVLDN